MSGDAQDTISSVSRHAVPAPLAERWLDDRGLAPGDLDDRLAFWRAREASFVARAEFDLEGPGPAVSRELRGRCETWFPVERIARDARAALEARFGPALAALDPEWRDDALARAESWADLRRALASLAHEALPSRWLQRLARDRDAAEALAFEAHDPRTHGCGFDRYPTTLERIAALGGERAWDAGCGTGEGTWDLAAALPGAQVVGTTTSPFELLMARRRGRPHDRARTLALRARTDGLAREGRVAFERGDVRVEAPAGDFDVVLVAGVLGGVLHRREEIASALRSIARALAPGGRAFVVDRFRDDLHARAARIIEDEARGAGLILVAPGELARAT
jgi:SAM-dependent methyltransferase